MPILLVLSNLGILMNFVNFVEASTPDRMALVDVELRVHARERDAAGERGDGSASRSLAAAKLWRARSRLYRSQILQVNMRWKALAEIYIMHSFAQLCNLIFFCKKKGKNVSNFQTED